MVPFKIETPLVMCLSAEFDFPCSSSKAEKRMVEMRRLRDEASSPSEI
jgi:hypothetical protein